jgi:hypothetical protein
MHSGILEKQLEPIFVRGSECVEPDLLFIVSSDDQEPWKIVFLVFIAFKQLLLLTGILH